MTDSSCKVCEFLGSDCVAEMDSAWWVCDHPVWDDEYDELGRATGHGYFLEPIKPTWCPKESASD